MWRRCRSGFSGIRRLALNGTALVAEHGSWNRTEKSGYRIIRLIFEGEEAREEVFLTGCRPMRRLFAVRWIFWKPPTAAST